MKNYDERTLECGCYYIIDDVAGAVLQSECNRHKKEIFISDEDKAMQVNTKIRPEPKIISDRRQTK